MLFFKFKIKLFCRMPRTQAQLFARQGIMRSVLLDTKNAATHARGKMMGSLRASFIGIVRKEQGAMPIIFNDNV